MTFSPEKTIRIQTLSIYQKLQSSFSTANIPDITPRTKTIMQKMIDFSF